MSKKIHQQHGKVRAKPSQSDIGNSSKDHGSQQINVPGIPPEFVRIANRLKLRIYIKDAQSRFLFANQATLDAHQVGSLEELRLKCDTDFFDGTHLASAQKDEEDLLLGKKEKIEKTEWETWLKQPGKPGRLTFVETTKQALHATDGEVTGIFGIALEIAQPDLAYEHDPGTARDNIGIYVREIDPNTENPKERRTKIWHSDLFLQTFPGKDFKEQIALVHPQDQNGVRQFLNSLKLRIGQTDGDILRRPNIFRIRDHRPDALPGSWRWIQAVAYEHRQGKSRRPRQIVVHYDADKGRAEEILGVEIIKRSPLFIFAKDAERKHRFMNPALLNFLKMSLQDVIGRTDGQLEISDASKFEEDDKKVIRGETIVRRVEKLTIKGRRSSKDLLTAKVPLPDDVFHPKMLTDGEKSNHVLGIAADVTKLIQNQTIEHLLSDTLFDKTSDGISLKDSKGRFLRVNHAFAAFFGLDVSDFPRKTAWQVLKGKLKREQIHQIEQEDEEVLKAGCMEPKEKTIRLNGKSPVTTLTRKVRLNNAPGCRGSAVLAISTDISNLIRAEKFSAYVPFSLKKDKDETKPVTKDIAVMFADLRGFTKATMTPGMPNDALIKLLHAWHTKIEALTHDNNFDCMVDKFIGDGAMLLFGRNQTATTDLKAHSIKCCTNACRFALLLRDEFELLMKEWRDTYKTHPIPLPTIALGIGISYGPALTGHFSLGRDPDRYVHYTAIGITVNLASRLENIAGKPARVAQKKVEDRPSLLVSQNIPSILEGSNSVFEFSEAMSEQLQGFEGDAGGLTRFYGLKGDTNMPTN